MDPRVPRLLDEIRSVRDLESLSVLNRALVAQLKALRSTVAAEAAFDLRANVGQDVTVVDPKRGRRKARLIEARRTRCLVMFAGDPRQWTVPAHWVQPRSQADVAAG